MSSRFDPSIFPARWDEHHARQALIAWRASGLSVRAFGIRHDLQVKRLYRWFERLGAGRLASAVGRPAGAPSSARRSAPSSPPPLAFVELVTAAPAGPSRPTPTPASHPTSARPPQREPFVIELGGVTLRVPPCFEPAALSELLGVLRC